MLTRGSHSERRRIGSYYTPKNVTDILCDWAIKSATDLVLEPSFGGCEFLDSSARRLKLVGCADPETQLFGCDIDVHAFDHLRARVDLTKVTDHFLLNDFLQVSPHAFGGRIFQAVIGNPPYVRHHDLAPEQKASAKRVRDTLLPTLNMQASLWAYFVLHASQFLADGGRVVWLLPSSFAHAYYANSLRSFLGEHFDKLTIIRLQERLFRLEGAEEGTVIVVGEGWRENGAQWCVERYAVAETIRDLRDTLVDDRKKIIQISKTDPHVPQNIKHARLLGDFCSFTIGVVTGDTDFFLFNQDKAKSHGIRAAHLKWIVSKAAVAQGLEITKEELKVAYKMGARTKILNPLRGVDWPVKKYLKNMPRERKEKNLTFTKRPSWFRPLDNKSTDAFFTGMSHNGPRLVLNAAGATCTNSLYRVVFRKKYSLKLRRLIALSLSTTFSQLSAEIVGRSYSAGMLKHEPSEAARISVIFPDRAFGNITKTFRAVDSFLKAGDVKTATHTADLFFLRSGCFTAKEYTVMRRELARLRSMRRTKKI